MTEQLRKDGLDAHELYSGNYTLAPAPSGPAAKVTIVYLGPYATQEEADQTCDRVIMPITNFCRVLQPVPG